MKYLPLLLVTIACPAGAQFSGLSVTGDGSTVYFSTPLRLRDSAQSFDGKLFRIASGGAPSLFMSQERGQPIAWSYSNFYNLQAPQVSSDGKVIAYTGTRACSGGSGCLAVQTAQGTLTDSSGKALLAAIGFVNLSPNGQYAVFSARNTFEHLAPPAEWISLVTGKRIDVPYSIGAAALRRIANDGTVAVIANGAIRLWQPTGEQTLPGPSAPAAPDLQEPLLLMSADARRLVYQTAKGLARFDRTASAEEILTTAIPTSVSINDDATVVVYVNPSDSQVYLAAPTRRLTNDAAGIAEVALSGDGRVVIAATLQGSLLRIDAASGAVNELVPRTPWITSPSFPSVDSAIFQAVAPGSLIALKGRGLAASSASSAAPLPRTLAGVRVRIGGLEAVLQSVSPGAVWLQVPWELSEQEGARVEFLSGDSPFETPPASVAIHAWAPNFFVTADPSTGYTAIAAHQDWSSLIASGSPARGGEIIFLYLSGLGPVMPAAATGMLSPADTLARITGPLRCQFWDGGPNDSTIYFAGLAPGMVGIYQVSLQVPMGLRVSPINLTCDFGFATASTFTSLPVTP